jgi:hypothetical protein
MIISINAVKALNKIQHHFITRALMKLEIEGMYFNIIKTTYDMLIAEIILNGEKKKLFPLMLITRQECPLSLHSYSTNSWNSKQEKSHRKKKSKEHKFERKKSHYPFLHMS